MAEPNAPNRSPEKEPAEGSRETVNTNLDDRDARERYDEAGADREGEGGGGITNRPLSEEIQNQRELPARGDAKPGGHAS